MNKTEDRLGRVYHATKRDEARFKRFLMNRRVRRQAKTDPLLESWLSEPEPGEVERSFVWVRSLEDGWSRDWKLAAIATPLVFDWLASSVPWWYQELFEATYSTEAPSGWLSPKVQWCRAPLDGPPGLKERAAARAGCFATVSKGNTEEFCA